MSREIRPSSCIAAKERNGAMKMSPNRPRAISDFDIRKMTEQSIVRRTLQQWSVHHSLTTSNWIATISRPTEQGSEKLRYIQFPFTTEKEARKFCKSYAPPQVCKTASCTVCQNPKARHCRNCGMGVCDRCSTRWGRQMVPKTYMSSQSTLTVTVCKSCDWLSNAFCMALLQGRFDDALAIHETGNVNLRTSFADIHREAMFPVHCAVMGANLTALQWLVDYQLCPISVNRDKDGRMLSVQTSESRTLLDLAMTGRPKVDILVYLVHKGLSIQDIKDPSLLPKTLEALLKTGLPTHDRILHDLHTIESHDESVATLDDPCIVCCERVMDCVFVPCGHQVCCSDCGKQLTACPVCKVQCSVLRIYRN